MTTQKDGGPAYPSKVTYKDWIPAPPDGPDTIRHGTVTKDHPGMSLRDWFAGQETLGEFDNPEACIGEKAATALAGEPKPQGGWAEDPLGMLRWEAKWRAALKYIRSDAMLAERDRKVGE